MGKKNKTYTSRAIDKLAGAAVVWLALTVIAELASVGLVAVELNLMSRIPDSELLDIYGGFNDPTGLSTLTGLGRIPEIFVFAITGFVVLKWVYRASRNAHAFARGLKTPPPWAVGWFFVPIAYLWKPFGAMSETWRVSVDPDGWVRRLPPDAMRWWWGFWIAASIMGTTSGRLGMMAENVGILRIATICEGLSDLASIGAALFLISLVREISRNQTRLIVEGRARPSAPPQQAWMDHGSDPF
jgi:hypothetical protein